MFEQLYELEDLADKIPRAQFEKIKTVCDFLTYDLKLFTPIFEVQKDRVKICWNNNYLYADIDLFPDGKYSWYAMSFHQTDEHSGEFYAGIPGDLIQAYRKIFGVKWF